jgi:hypothetical protein
MAGAMKVSKIRLGERACMRKAVAHPESAIMNSYIRSTFGKTLIIHRLQPPSAPSTAWRRSIVNRRLDVRINRLPRRQIIDALT